MDLGFLIIWLFLFVWRKDVRKTMLFISIPLGFMGPFLEYLYVNDWWSPLTITGTLLGIEDFFFGFLIGGISAVIYEELFKKRIRERKFSKKIRDVNRIFFWITAAMGIIAFYFCYFIIGLNTFVITTSLLIILIAIMYVKRRDLIIDSLVSGFLLVVISSIVYIAVEIITPGWVYEFWHFKFFPKVLFLGLPIDDIIFYFLFGAAVAPLYEYWQEGRLINKK
jgi:hypothetical protein